MLGYIIFFITISIIWIYISTEYNKKIIKNYNNNDYQLLMDNIQSQELKKKYNQNPRTYISIKNIKDNKKIINISEKTKYWSIEFSIIPKITPKNNTFCILKNNDNIQMINYENNKFIFYFSNISGNFKTKSSIPELNFKIDMPIKIKWIQDNTNSYILINDKCYLISDERQDFKQYLSDNLIFNTNDSCLEYQNVIIDLNKSKINHDLFKSQNNNSIFNCLLYHKKSELIKN